MIVVCDFYKSKMSLAENTTEMEAIDSANAPDKKKSKKPKGTRNNALVF